MSPLFEPAELRGARQEHGLLDEMRAMIEEAQFMIGEGGGYLWAVAPGRAEFRLDLNATERKERVLIADDSPAVRQSVVRLLDDVETVEVVGQSGDVASTLSAIRDLAPDVVILDLRMPGGNGIDVLEAIRQGSWRPKVIVLTNYPFPQYRRRCLEAGASFFLDKATEFDQLPWALKQLGHSAGMPGAGSPPGA